MQTIALILSTTTNIYLLLIILKYIFKKDKGMLVWADVSTIGDYYKIYCKDGEYELYYNRRADRLSPFPRAVEKLQEFRRIKT